MVKVLALIDSRQVSGPCQGLFELIEHSDHAALQFVLGLFLREPAVTSPAVEEAVRRGLSVAILMERRRYDPGLISQAWRIVQTRKFNVLQSHGYKSALLAWLLRQLTGLPWVAFVHGYTSENRRMAVYNRLDQWLVKRADRVVAVSKATASLLRHAGVPEDRTRVIYNAADPRRCGVNLDAEGFRYSCGIDRKDLLVGVIGRLSPEKGQAVFVESFSKVVYLVKEAKAVIVGEGQDLLILRRAVSSAGLGDRIRFVGYQDQMSSVYAALDLVVIPSLSEGLPNVLLEAMLHGRAVVATSVGGIPEVMSGRFDALLVPPRDPIALANAIIGALRDRNLRTELGQSGEKYVREMFSPEGRSRQVKAVYKELLGLSETADI